MIILDLSQIVFANMHAQLDYFREENFSIESFRAAILTSIRKNIMLHKKTYGNELVIACDSIKSWRKAYFPYYKEGRKKFREAQDIDWKKVFQNLSIVKEELRQHFPYKVIEIEGAEADDVMGTLVHKYGTILGDSNKILIISGDKDFSQLQTYSNVDQYDPIKKKFIKCQNPDLFLIDHVIRGDKGDGVPNILSADDTFIREKGRNVTLSKKRVENLMAEIAKDSCSSIYYYRNRMMIDLTKTPNEIKEKILESYNEQENKPKNKIMNYFIINRMKNFIETTGDFN